MDLMALGDALTLEADDLALACALKSPLFGLDENDLYALAHGRAGTLAASLREQARSDTRIAGGCGEARPLARRSRPPCGRSTSIRACSGATAAGNG